MKYKVRSGALRETVFARNPSEAFVVALQVGKPKALGLLCEITKAGQAPEYMSTERCLKELGIRRFNEKALRNSQDVFCRSFRR